MMLEDITGCRSVGSVNRTADNRGLAIFGDGTESNPRSGNLHSAVRPDQIPFGPG